MSTAHSEENGFESWDLEELGKVADVHLGKTPKKSDYRDEGKHRIVKFRDLKAGQLDLSIAKAGFVADDPEALKGLRPLRVGDVLVTASAHSGEQIGKKCAYVDQLPEVDGGVYFVGELLRVTANLEEMEPEWPYLWFSSKRGRSAIQDAVAGVHLTQGRARKIPIPLPSPDAQKAVLRWTRAATRQVNAAEDRLERAEALLDRFGKSVLKAAIAGRLTDGWRAAAADEEPSGRELVEMIAAERQRKGVKKWAASSSIEADQALPDRWTWCTAADVAVVQLGGTPARAEARYWNGGIPWVSSGEVANCRISETRERISEAGLSESSAKLYPAGSVLIAMIGEGKTRGQSAILDIEAATNQNAAGLVFDTDYVNPDYVWCWALAEYARTRAVGRGGAQPALNKQKVAELRLPLPPRTEQDEIVRRVEASRNLAGRAAERIGATRGLIEKVGERSLARAFAPAFGG